MILVLLSTGERFAILTEGLAYRRSLERFDCPLVHPNTCSKLRARIHNDVKTPSQWFEQMALSQKNSSSNGAPGLFLLQISWLSSLKLHNVVITTPLE